MTGLAIEPHPPETASDTLGSIVSTLLAASADTSDLALLLDSELNVEGSDCSFSFILVPGADGVDELLARLGL